MTSADVSAQSTQSWTGSTPQEASGKTVFLYNVGTGRFLVHGGDWGTQARLFNKDYGKTMTLQGNGNGNYTLITGVNTGDAANLGCNVPEVTSTHEWKGNKDQETFTILMDADASASGDRKWTFTPVGDGTNTYYMNETMSGIIHNTVSYYTVTISGAKYYLKVTPTSSGVTLSTVTNKAEATQFANYENRVGFLVDGVYNYLKYNGSAFSIGSDDSNRLGGADYITYGNYTTYYLCYYNNNITFRSSTTNGFRIENETVNQNVTKVWLGAVYGENGPSNANPGEGHEGDPVGKLCLLASGFDKAVWSTADPTSSTEYDCQLKGSETAYLNYDNEANKTVKRSMQTAVRVFNNDTFVPLNDLYKWKIITEEEFMSKLQMADLGDGLETNLTWKITDRGFERNDNNFFDNSIGWRTGRLELDGVSYTTNGRYGQTWGYSTSTSVNNQTGGNRLDGRGYNEPWNAPVRLKTQWTDKNNAKYGFMSFEGVGTASTYIEVTTDGVYRISCYGFYQGNNPGYLFATTSNPQTTGTNTFNPNGQGVVFKTANLNQVAGSPYTYSDKNDEGSVTRSSAGNYTGSGVMFAGATFVNDFPNRDDFYREVEITIEGASASNPKRIYLGVGKNGATQGESSSNGYYYDQDYVGVDQFNIQYLGTDEPITFDESKEDWTYLPEGGNDRQRSIRLKRAFKTDKWNSFVFPYNLTGTQVRNAFGDGTRVAKLDGLGTITNDANIIDFASVSLPEGTGIAIEANKFYLIKPSDPLPDAKDYYDMGTQVYKYSELPQGVQTAHYDIGENAAHASGHNTIISKATYWATTNYATFDRNNLTAVTNGIYAPAKSYVISDSQMYYIKNPNRIKGFRGWIEDVDAATGTTGGAKLALNGVFDENEISGINDIFTEEVIVPSNGSIYDLSGRKVAGNASQLNALPKGMYIVNGKKYIVK